MAFGYIEGEYGILKDWQHPARDGTVNVRHYELRQDVRGNEPPYIALFTTAASGEVVSDLLLRYREEEVARADWARLIGPEVVKLSDLDYIERIENHHIGYGRDGDVAMY